MKFKTFLVMFLVCLSVSAQWKPAVWGDWQRWGDQGDGTYCNPVMPMDYSDIDCIGHEGWYYAISSTFQFSPGMVILRSRDMVNWQICSHAVSDLRQIGPALNWDQMDRYARGIWAGAIRWHQGRFYVYFGCPDEGMFMTSAARIEGPWEPLHHMNIPGGWDDCCPLFDADGRNYFVATHFADGYKTYVFPLSADGKEVDFDSRVLINEGWGREANKLYHLGQYYYHLYSEDNGGRYLCIQRATNPMGPYTEPHRMSETQAEWNEPNQGGFLQDEAGEWWFLTHHGHGDWGGREASLLPVSWDAEGWPVVGQPDVKTGYGRMVWQHQKPQVSSPFKGDKRGSSSITRFDDPEMEWNYQPREGYYTQKAKRLTLRAFAPLEQGNLLKAGNTLTWRSAQVPSNEVVVRVDLRKMAEGQRSGLCHFSSSWSEFGVKMQGGKRLLYHHESGRDEQLLAQDVPATLWLRSTWSLDARCHYAWSADGKVWNDMGVLYQLQWGNYRGDRSGLFTYGERGSCSFDQFHYTWSDEMAVENPFGQALVPDMIADASIELIADTFYCYATTDGMGRGLETSGPPVVWKSTDFEHWSFSGTYFPQALHEKYWAPSKAIARNGHYYIYPTINGKMYACQGESPNGPFHLMKGDTFTPENRLYAPEGHDIDAEIFIDKDDQAYVFWGSRRVAKLADDMCTLSDVQTIPTRVTRYSEGPIFFQRDGIYYYLYTIGGDEHYEYYYQMSRVSPTGPWETPLQDLVCTTNWERGAFGPGHGCVFQDEGTGRWYLAFLEFGRNSTNRQTYVRPLNFNADGTIQQVDINLDGVGALRASSEPEPLRVAHIEASSVADRHLIRYFKDWRCQRTEQFVPQFAVDGSNGSRWMAADGDKEPTLTIDLGSVQQVSSSRLCFVRPTAGHAYTLEGSVDGKVWKTVGGHLEPQMTSPHVDRIGERLRYLRVTITSGIPGVWEWRVE